MMKPISIRTQEEIHDAIFNEQEYIIDPTLEELSLMCYYPQLVISLETAKSIAEKLKNHKALTKIQIDGHPLCYDSARLICRALATIETLKEVAFIDTFTSPDAMRWIVELINAKPKLKSLILDDNIIFTFMNSKELFSALELSQLEELRILSNIIGENEDTIDLLANFLKRNNSLKIFAVGELQPTPGKISDSGWAKIFDGLAENSSITRLKLYGYVSGDISIARLVNCFRINKHLTDLDLARSKLADPHIVSLIESIMATDSIQYLDLSSNDIAAQGHQTLAKYLARTNWLVYLNVSFGENRGLRYLWEGIKKNSTLLHLEMYGISKETFHISDAERSLLVHPTILEFECDSFMMGKYNPFTEKLQENKKKIRRSRKDITFIVLMLAKGLARSNFPPEIWLLILHHVTIPSYTRLARASLLFDCIIKHYDEIFGRIERREKFKIIQHNTTFEIYLDNN